MKLSKLPISAVMVVYHEADIIERALKSCADVVDEIIVVHDGPCKDATLEICKKYGCKVFELPHIGEAEAHRAFTFEQAKNDWILQLDADEYLSKELQENLKSLISSDAGIYEIPWSTYLNGSHHFWSYKRMLFRRSKVYYIGISHENVRELDTDVKVCRVGYGLLHEPRYDNFTISTFKKKWKKWASVHAQQLTTDFAKLSKWNCSTKDFWWSQKVRINHPILFGIIGTPIYHAPFFIKAFIRHRRLYILKQWILMTLYYIYLYYYVYLIKRNQK